MSNFTYYTPTKVVFENNAEEKAGEMLTECGAKKVLIHYGSERVIKTGLMQKITDSISACGIEYVMLGGVVPNPRLSLVYKGIELCKAENIDFILAVGGGSVIDSAKAISFGVKYDGDVWDFYEKDIKPASALPIACVLTIPAAGSEMSDSSVITKEDGGFKRDCSSSLNICKFALMNPLLTQTLPTHETVNGVVDIMMHTLERYFHNLADFDITDSIAEGLLKCVMRNALILKKDPQNTTARENIMWAGSLAHNSLTGCGGGGGDWSTHIIEHELSGLFDVSHGAGLSAVWGSWARHVLSSNPHRFAKFAKNVMDIVDFPTEKETGLAGIIALEKFFAEIGSPISISELLCGAIISDEQIDFMAEGATLHGKRVFGLSKSLKKDDVVAIYQMAKL